MNKILHYVVEEKVAVVSIRGSPIQLVLQTIFCKMRELFAVLEAFP